jgi:predicted O-methyltransferase YrrM
VSYIRLWEECKSRTYPQILEYCKDYPVDEDWFQNLALHTQVVRKGSQLCYEHGRVLYATLARFVQDRDDIKIIETGTARGFSALVMAKVLKDFNKRGHIKTFDILPHDKRQKWNCIDDETGEKTREELLAPWKDLLPYIEFISGDTKKKLVPQEVDFAFIDGSHTYEDIKHETNCLKGVKVIVFDDYTPSQFPGIVRAVDECKGKKTYLHSNRGYVICES